MKKLLKSEVCGSINSARDPLMCLFCCEKSRVEKSKTTAEKRKRKKESNVDANGDKIIRIQTTSM